MSLDIACSAKRCSMMWAGRQKPKGIEQQIAEIVMGVGLGRVLQRFRGDSTSPIRGRDGRFSAMAAFGAAIPTAKKRRREVR